MTKIEIGKIGQLLFMKSEKFINFVIIDVRKYEDSDSRIITINTCENEIFCFETAYFKKSSFPILDDGSTGYEPDEGWYA